MSPINLIILIVIKLLCQVIILIINHLLDPNCTSQFKMNFIVTPMVGNHH